MTLEEKRRELLDIVHAGEVARETVRQRLNAVSLELEVARSELRDVSAKLNNDKQRLATFKDYFDAEAQ